MPALFVGFGFVREQECAGICVCIRGMVCQTKHAKTGAAYPRVLRGVSVLVFIRWGRACMYLCIHACVCLCICVHIYIYIYIYIYKYIYLYVCTYDVCGCMYACMHVRTYVHTYVQPRTDKIDI